MGKLFRLVCDWCAASSPEVDERALHVPPPSPIDVEDQAMSLKEAMEKYRLPPSPYPPGWSYVTRRGVGLFEGPSPTSFEDCLCPTCSERLTRFRNEAYASKSTGGPAGSLQ